MIGNIFCSKTTISHSSNSKSRGLWCFSTVHQQSNNTSVQGKNYHLGICAHCAGCCVCLQNFFPKVHHCPQSYSQNFKTNAYHHKCLLIWQRKVCRILGITGVNLLKLAQIICQILSLGLDKDAQLPPSSSADSCIVVHIKDVKCWCSGCIRWTQTIWQLRQAELRQSSKNTIWSSCKDNTNFKSNTQNKVLAQYTLNLASPCIQDYMHRPQHW